MLFLINIRPRNILLGFCILLLLCAWWSPPDPHPQYPLGMEIELLLLPTAYVLWRFRRPVKWIIGALIFVTIFFYTLMAGLLGKHPEPEIEEE